MTVRALVVATGLAVVAVIVVVIAAASRNSGSGNTDVATLRPAPVLAPATVQSPGPGPTVTPPPRPTATPPAAAATATPPPPTPIPTATPTPRALTMSFSGDILSHMPVIQRAQANGTAELAYDYRPMFAQVQSRLSAADLAICVLETPLSADNGDLSGYPSFNAPADLANALLEAGFDGCATASNHSLDRGEAGVTETLDALDRVGLGHAGMARTAEEHDETRIYDVNGVRVAHLSFTYGLNGYVRPEGKDWMVDVTDPALVLRKADQARSDGADIVVLTIQWGNEYVTDPTADQQTLAEIFAASPNVDLIVGNHAHVVQPIGSVGGTPVIYGLGNFLSNQPAPGYPARTQDGMMVEVSFVEERPGSMRVADIVVVPTWVDKSTYTILPVQASLGDETIGAERRDVLEISLERTIDAVSRLDYPLNFE